VGSEPRRDDDWGPWLQGLDRPAHGSIESILNAGGAVRAMASRHPTSSRCPCARIRYDSYQPAQRQALCVDGVLRLGAAAYDIRRRHQHLRPRLSASGSLKPAATSRLPALCRMSLVVVLWPVARARGMTRRAWPSRPRAAGFAAAIALESRRIGLLGGSFSTSARHVPDQPRSLAQAYLIGWHFLRRQAMTGGPVRQHSEKKAHHSRHEHPRVRLVNQFPRAG
jgi:hypothetical protein